MVYMYEILLTAVLTNWPEWSAYKATVNGKYLMCIAIPVDILRKFLPVKDLWT